MHLPSPGQRLQAPCSCTTCLQPLWSTFKGKAPYQKVKLSLQNSPSQIVSFVPLIVSRYFEQHVTLTIIFQVPTW